MRKLVYKVGSCEFIFADITALTGALVDISKHYHLAEIKSKCAQTYHHTLKREGI